jgi:hypothetical protein
MGDDENNIVHTATWSTAGLWFAWAAAALAAGAVWCYHHQWLGVDFEVCLGRPSEITDAPK